MAHTRSRRARARISLRMAAGLFVSAALVLALVAWRAGADSAMYRGGSRLTGAYADRLTLPLSVLWKYTASPDAYNTSAPAVVGDTVFFGSADRFLAVDTATGALKWRFPQDATSGVRFRTAPAVADGYVYVGGDDGRLYQLNASTGRPGWLFDTRSQVTGSPIYSEGVLYFGTADGKLWAIDCRTGVEVPNWKGGVALSDTTSGSPAVGNGMVYVVTDDQVLTAIAQTTGKSRGGVRLGGNPGFTSPVLDGEYVYVVAGNNLFCFTSRNLLFRWRAEFPSDIASSPAVNDQGLFVVTRNEHRVYNLDARTGRRKWRSPPQLDFDVIAAPTVSGDNVFVATVRGGVYAVDTGTGAVKWSYQLQPSSNREDSIVSHANIAAAPVVSDGTLYVLGDDGSLAALRNDAVDTTPPSITETLPEMGIVINGAPPIRFEAKIVDEGSGLDPSSLKLLIDGQSVVRKPISDEDSVRSAPGFTFDPRTSMLEYDTPAPQSAGTVRPLSDGRHTVTITAADWRGNVATKSWNFTVDNTVTASGRKRTLPRTSASTIGPRGPGVGGTSGGFSGPTAGGSGGGRRGGRGGVAGP